MTTKLPIKTFIGIDPSIPGHDGWKYDFSDGTLLPDGTPRAHPDFLGGVVWSPQVRGAIALSDGTVYNIDDKFIQCKPEHNGPLAHHIHLIHNSIGATADDGSPLFPPHVCDESCGFERLTQ